MKGTIITGYLDWVRGVHGEDFVDEVLDESKLEGDGSFTSVGVYPYTDLMEIIRVTAERTGEDFEDLVFRFSRESFGGLSHSHEFLLEGIKDGLHLLEVTESHIHVEILAMYPDTILPTIMTKRRDDGSLEVHYSSRDPLASMCEGRIWGALDIFKQDGTVEVLEMSDDRRKASYLVTLKGGAE